MNSSKPRGGAGIGMASTLLAALTVLACFQPLVMALTEDEDHWYADFPTAQQSPDRTVSAYNPPDREHDPFMPVVMRRQTVRTPDVYPGEKADDTPINVPPPPLPLHLGVLCIVGNASRRLALVEHEGTVREMTVGDEIPDRFKITGINQDSLEIYSYLHRARRRFALGDR